MWWQRATASGWAFVLGLVIEGSGECRCGGVELASVAGIMLAYIALQTWRPGALAPAIAFTAAGLALRSPRICDPRRRRPFLCAVRAPVGRAQHRGRRRAGTLARDPRFAGRSPTATRCSFCEECRSGASRRRELPRLPNRGRVIGTDRAVAGAAFLTERHCGERWRGSPATAVMPPERACPASDRSRPMSKSGTRIPAIRYAV